MLINENKRTVLCDKTIDIRVGISILNYQGGGNNSFDFPFLVFHVDDQRNTRQRLVVVEGKQWKCGSGGGGRKTIEILRSKHGRKEKMVVEIATILDKSLRESIHNFGIHDSIHNFL